MTTIPAESSAYIKPFDGTDIICLLEDCVEWFDIDSIASVLCTNVCHALKQLPRSQKALWKELEPNVNSEKQFITSLGVRLLIAKTQEVDVVPPPRPSTPPCASYYYNTPLEDEQCASTSSCRRNRNHQHHRPKYELSPTMHNLGNIFINEAIYDIRAYRALEDIDHKINKIYDLVVQQLPNNNNNVFV
ncbi:PEP-1 [Mocis latipes granulovirus]|uniref:PEP-1 n=1 Tax=Mocis latipes granulovirus TaxID=2072024 RepID=A0A162GWJ1_9BBAC|nr:PEP-1 [Mocis latipes granulovirus]AKR17489.1 PEP-1 [Mocis latipes granulovirus]